MSVTLKLVGVKEIDNVLKQLPLALSHSVMSSAHAMAAKPLLSRMQGLAPEGPTGNLVDSLGIVKSSVKKAQVIGEVKVGPRKPKGSAGHLVEYGTRRRKTRRGANRGQMKAKPFVKPAFQQTKSQVEQGIALATGKVVIRTMKKYLK